MNEQQFVDEVLAKGIELNKDQIKRFKIYYEVLIDHNNRMNLTSLTKKEDVYLKHFYDSLTLLFYYPLKEKCKVCDVGAGAGFPSIPLKIIKPDLKITIVDSLGKRIKFLNHLIKELALKDVETVHHRAEKYAISNRETFDVVTARAVARLNILAELCMPLVKIKGKFIAMKGQSGLEEWMEARKSIHSLGGSLFDKHEFSLPFDGGLRNILVFTKNNKTPNKYPRNYSQIKNKPL